jgi:integrase
VEYNPVKEISIGRHAPGHIGCPECARAHQVLYQSLSPELYFDQAFEIWMSHRTIQTLGVNTDASYLAPNSVKDYRASARALSKFFGKLCLEEIHPGHLMAYQQARAVCDKSAANWAKPANSNQIRKEIDLLIRILRAGRVWGDEQELHFQRVRVVEPEARRAMTPEEQHRLLHVASSREDWRMIYQYAIVALQTTASTNELRALRLGDILLGDRIIQIPRAGAKNKFRMRTIPLVTDDAMWAIEGLEKRAHELGASSPAHFLFPIQRKRWTYDPTRPMCNSGLRKRWDEVRMAAQLPWLRIYDLRHTGITRMAEAGVPLRVTMNFAGHMTVRMQQRYEAISMAAKRGWGEAVWGTLPGREPGGGGNGGGAQDEWPIRKPVRSEKAPWAIPRAV